MYTRQVNSIEINLENCYGIKKLKHDFDFSQGSTFAVYAPNGAMKTSFAKTFKDFSNGEDSKDLIFPSRPTVRAITKDGGTPLNSQEVFVVEPYNEEFNSSKMSTLLVSKTLKERYDTIHAKIDEGKEKLLKELKKQSGVKESIETEVALTFFSSDKNPEQDFYRALGRVEKEVLDDSEPEFADIIYGEVFNEKVYDFLKTKDFKDTVQDYIQKYEELIRNSSYFKKGIFNHNNASVIAKNLVDNGFFKAEHSVHLYSKDGDKEIHTKEELEQVIEEEKNKILNDPTLKKFFDEVDTKLKGNKELRDFRDYLLLNPRILPELKEQNNFRQRLWITYLKLSKDLFANLIKEYHESEKELNEIAKAANQERTKWIDVLSTFNQRFSVPFELRMQNQSDVILRSELPSIVFIFKDSMGETPVNRDNLLLVLSNGEKRALYILNIIFEVQARTEDNQETLFIVDDIADSFDYKNKYAIIQYLKDISTSPLFKQIILTHNFDFFRTLQSRFIKPQQCLVVEKGSNEVNLVDAEYTKSPFKYWMNHLDDDKTLIASIPFVRNIIEYTRGSSDADYLKLTSLLHIKAGSTAITKTDLAAIYNIVFPSLSLNLANPTEKVLDVAFQLTTTCLAAPDSINFENKILLSIVIRLKAEMYMVSKISDKTEPSSNQTMVYVERYKNDFKNNSGELNNISTLEEVNLMTPENIHLNSFMYEPILDMSDEHLRNLCKRVESLS